MKIIEELIASLIIIFIISNFVVLTLGTFVRVESGYNKICSFKKYNILLPAEYISCKMTQHISTFFDWLGEDIND